MKLKLTKYSVIITSLITTTKSLKRACKFFHQYILAQLSLRHDWKAQIGKENITDNLSITYIMIYSWNLLFLVLIAYISQLGFIFCVHKTKLKEIINNNWSQDYKNLDVSITDSIFMINIINWWVRSIQNPYRHRYLALKKFANPKAADLTSCFNCKKRIKQCDIWYSFPVPSYRQSSLRYENYPTRYYLAQIRRTLI